MRALPHCHYGQSTITKWLAASAVKIVAILVVDMEVDQVFRTVIRNQGVSCVTRYALQDLSRLALPSLPHDQFNCSVCLTNSVCPLNTLPDSALWPTTVTVFLVR